MVEIAKAMSFNPSILLLDEPTSALATGGQAALRADRRLRARGVTMIYITHRMSELFEIADTCTVLRDGQLIGSVEMAAGHARHDRRDDVRRDLRTRGGRRASVIDRSGAPACSRSAALTRARGISKT